MIIVGTIVKISIFAAIILYLAVEKYLLDYWRDRTSVRICVTGTRGKSSVVRLVHAGLNQADTGFIGKVTGSRATYINPDGNEDKIKRRGPPSILEQRKLLLRAFRQETGGFVAEIMSISPENHLIEANRLLKPNYLVVTRIQKDHTFRMGKTKQEIAQTIGLTVSDQAKVLLSNRDLLRLAPEAFAGKDLEVVFPSDDLLPIAGRIMGKLPYFEFTENVILALEVCRSVGVEVDKAADAMAKTEPDLGSLRAWTLRGRKSTRPDIAVSAFATNNPASARHAFERISREISVDSLQITGILNVREDRGARSNQWISQLNSEFPIKFDRLIVTGTGANAVGRKLTNARFEARVTTEASPEEITKRATEGNSKGTLIFGFGNIKGGGEEMIGYWSRVGEAYGT